MVEIKKGKNRKTKARKQRNTDGGKYLNRFIFEIEKDSQYLIQRDRALVEAVGNAYPYGDKGRNPDPEKVKALLEDGAQPDFVMPWLPTNKRRR